MLLALHLAAYERRHAFILTWLPKSTPNHAPLFDQNEISHPHNHFPIPYKQPTYIL